MMQGNGVGLYGKTLLDEAAAGMLATHTYRSIARQCIVVIAKSTFKRDEETPGTSKPSSIRTILYPKMEI